MRIYFDTTCWIRLTETNLEHIKDPKRKEIIEKERNAVIRILDENKHQIISSKHQLNQLYSKATRADTSDEKKHALSVAIAFCLEKTGNTTNTDPPYNEFPAKLKDKSDLRDAEDAKHLVIAWIREVDVFLTTDRELYHDKKNDIEESLSTMCHPNPSVSKIPSIRNPLGFS